MTSAIFISMANGSTSGARRRSHDIVNPADETTIGTVVMGGKLDADAAVEAARRAFDGYSQTSLEERRAMLARLQAVFERRYTEMAQAISTEMGAPCDLAYDSQAECGPGHIKAALEAAESFSFESRSGPNGDLVCEPIGVCALITPWNWPINQIMSKLAPALLTGCTVVLKPSEFAPLVGAPGGGVCARGGLPAWRVQHALR